MALGLDDDDETTAANLYKIGQNVRYHLDLKKELEGRNPERMDMNLDAKT